MAIEAAAFAKLRPLKTYAIPHTDLQVSRIAYGCASLAGWNKDPIRREDIARASAIVEVALDNGMTLFDHADLYGFGKAEELFGKVLQKNSGLRDRLVIQSKCGQVFTDAGFEGPIRINLSHEHIVRSVEGSLQRLGTDRLDILLLHVADSLVQPEEVASAFETLHGSGKVRNFGVSNHNAAQIQLLKKHVRQPIVINQVRVSLGHPQLLTDGMEFALALTRPDQHDGGYSALAGSGTLDYCRMNDIQIQAWSPLRGGLLNGPENAAAEFKVAAQLLADMARNKQTTVSAVALAWLLRHPAGIVPIIGSANAKHITECCEADRVELTGAEWYDLLAATSHLKARAL